jgi:hypothetical protein
LISRRFFICSSVAAFFLDGRAWALGRKPRAKPEPVVGGPRTIARQEWPPAITPEYVGIVDKGYACFADDMGRLAVVDLKREDNPLVIGELFGIGRKVVACAITQHRAHAVVQLESGSETVFQMVTVSLTPASDISIMSRLPLSNFSEPTCIAAFGELVAVGGSGLANENQIVFYASGRKKSVDLLQVSALTLEHSPFRLDLQDRQLLALCGLDSTELVVISTANPRAPERIKTLPLSGSFPVLARNRDQIMVAGCGFDRQYRVSLVSLRPSPLLSTSAALTGVSEILDLGAQKGQFLALANQGARQVVVPLAVGKKNALSARNPVMLPSGAHGASPRAHIAVKEREAYIASDWGGVQVLNVAKDGWQFSYSHTIPRLPASGLVLDGNYVVIACAELKRYDLRDLRHPVLVDSTDINGTILAMLSLGRTFLCLSRDALTVRSVNRPAEQISSLKTKGSALAYDSTQACAYVISQSDRGCRLSPYKVAEDGIKGTLTSIDLPVPARKAAAQSGRLLLAGLNELNLYKMEATPQLVGTRKFPNLAVRDVVIAGADLIYVSCLDENLKGSLLALSAAKEDLPILGACDLPVDAGAFAVAGNRAVVVGTGKGGKDMVALLSTADPAQMKVRESFETLESASAVVIRDKTAIIAGRGIEIIDLS